MLVDEASRVDMLFDRHLLISLRQLISQFTADDYVALTKLPRPQPRAALLVLRAVVVLVKPYLRAGQQLLEWNQATTVYASFVDGAPVVVN